MTKPQNLKEEEAAIVALTDQISELLQGKDAELAMSALMSAFLGAAVGMPGFRYGIVAGLTSLADTVRSMGDLPLEEAEKAAALNDMAFSAAPGGPTLQ